MNESIWLVAATLAGLFCPLHMWWSHRRGREPACCLSARKGELGEVEELRARQERLRGMIAEHDRTAMPTHGDGPVVDAR